MFIAAIIVLFAAILAAVPPVRSAVFSFAGLLAEALYNIFALLLITSFAALLFWYLFRMLLPGLLRYRRLRQLEYQRAVRRAMRKDTPKGQLPDERNSVG